MTSEFFVYRRQNLEGLGARQEIWVGLCMHEISYSGYRPEVSGFYTTYALDAKLLKSCRLKVGLLYTKYNVDEITECLGFERAVSGQRQKNTDLDPDH